MFGLNGVEEDLESQGKAALNDAAKIQEEQLKELEKSKDVLKTAFDALTIENKVQIVADFLAEQRKDPRIAKPDDPKWAATTYEKLLEDAKKNPMWFGVLELGAYRDEPAGAVGPRFAAYVQKRLDGKIGKMVQPTVRQPIEKEPKSSGPSPLLIIGGALLLLLLLRKKD
jgi:hypothetical protein